MHLCLAENTPLKNIQSYWPQTLNSGVLYQKFSSDKAFPLDISNKEQV